MQKLTSRRRCWQRNRARAELHKVRKKAGKLVLRKAYILIDGQVRTAFASEPIHSFPKVMCVATNPGASISSLRSLRNNLAVSKRGKRGYRPDGKRAAARIQRLGRHWDFTEIKYLHPTTALLIAAEFNRIYMEGQSKPWFSDIDKLDSKVFHILLEIGFFDFFGMTDVYARQKTAELENLRIVPIQSGLGTDSRGVGELTAALFSLFPTAGQSQAGSQDAVRTALYGAMIEAMVNVHRHAFDGPHRWHVKPQRRWWASGTTDVNNRTITAALYDDGATIPITLPNSSKWSGIRRRLFGEDEHVGSEIDPSRDSEAIIAATIEGKTSTSNDHNGKGLHQIVEFINSCEAGYVRIASRFGVAEFRPRQAPIGLTNKQSIGGTLVEWSVKV